MASSKEYLDYVLEQLSETGDVTSRAMMGEYILYFRGKVIGGIYDNRLLVKPVKAARRMMPDASRSCLMTARNRCSRSITSRTKNF